MGGFARAVCAERALETDERGAAAGHGGQLNAGLDLRCSRRRGRARAGAVRRILRQSGERSGKFLWNLFQPESIVLGGGLAAMAKAAEPSRMLTFPQTFRGEDRNTEIVCASLGNDAGLVGAAMLCRVIACEANESFACR